MQFHSYSLKIPLLGSNDESFLGQRAQGERPAPTFKSWANFTPVLPQCQASRLKMSEFLVGHRLEIGDSDWREGANSIAIAGGDFRENAGAEVGPPLSVLNPI